MHFYFVEWQQTNNETTKIIKQLNYSVNASESTGISNQELNINCSHTTFLS